MSSTTTYRQATRLLTRLSGYAVLLAIASVTHAQIPVGMVVGAPSHSDTRELVLQDHSVSLDQAVAMVEAKYRAKALRYNTVEDEGKPVHTIRLMTVDKSRVFTVRIDAATGQELPPRE